MIECRNCRAFLGQTPEQIGARCPDCRMPLFERDDRPKRGEPNPVGYCDKHPASQAVAACERCLAKLCATCKTKWNDQTMCLECQARSVEAGEPHPRELAGEKFEGVVSFVAGAVTWFLVVFAYLLLWMSQPRHGLSSTLNWWATLLLLALLPAVLAVGQGLSAAMGRSSFRNWGLTGMLMGGLHLGLTTGLLLLNFVRN